MLSAERLSCGYREAQQVTGLDVCQCRKACIQGNPIMCALLVWYRPKELVYRAERTVHQLRYRQLSEYLIQELKSPLARMALV